MSADCGPAERFCAGAQLAPHRHRQAYAALVVEGVYEEISYDGRYVCAPGTLVVHPRFHRHADRFGDEGGRVINIPLADGEADRLGYRVLALSDPGRLLDAAQHDPARATGLVFDVSGDDRTPAAPPEWVCRFLAEVMHDAPVTQAARRAGVSVEHAGRVVRHWFGDTPVRLRAEGRLRRAIAALRDGAPIAEAAALAGFADQPHLTRMLRSATGLTPRQLRAA